jgi:rhodanese-related sulfurtransferase
MIAKLMGLKTISPRDLQALVGGLQVAVFDVNSRASWQEAHVPGAVPLDPDGFERGDLPAAEDAGLVFYCSGPLCRKAPRAARRAKDMGYANVRVMSAGIRGWMAAGLPTESGSAT